MSFVDRSYPDLVRDVLTTLTQGVAQEVHHVTYDASAQPVTVPDIALERRPVRRVSVVAGKIAPPNPGDPPVPYTFSLNDYTLVPGPQDPTDLSTIRFLRFGKKPAPDTDVLVNYYPRTTNPTPLTDLNVGSAVRTIVEAVSKELGVLYAQLNLAYDSGFVETATGSSLDRVVALLGLARFHAGYPTGTVQFTRRAGASGSITIPAGTPVTDGAKTRYVTAESHDMLAGESSAQVAVRGATPTTPVVDAFKLIAIGSAIAGLDTVTNPAPTTRAQQDESDEQLRARARSALLGSSKGTLDAIKYGLLQLPGVTGVDVVEPPDTPGELLVHVRVATGSPNDPLPQTVLDRIEELRAAGIRVNPARAPSKVLAARLALVLASGTQAQSDDVHATAAKTLANTVAQIDGGKTIRTKPLVAALLADKRVVDATLTLSEKNAAPPPPAAGTDYTPAIGTFVQLDQADVTFEPDTFEGPAAAAGASIAVDVHATMKLTLVVGVTSDAAAAQIRSRLQTLLTALVPGHALSFTDVLNALRDDAKYAIDPLGTQIAFQAGGQFTALGQDGAYPAPPGRTYTVVTPVITP